MCNSVTPMKYEEQLITLQNCFVSYPCPSYELVHIIDPNPYRFRTSQPPTPPPTDCTTTTAASASSRQLKVCYQLSPISSTKQRRNQTLPLPALLSPHCLVQSCWCSFREYPSRQRRDMATSVTAAAASQQQLPAAAAASHAPSVAGSVIETPNGLGGTCLIRIQNMSSTGEMLCLRSE